MAFWKRKRQSYCIAELTKWNRTIDAKDGLKCSKAQILGGDRRQMELTFSKFELKIPTLVGWLQSWNFELNFGESLAPFAFCHYLKFELHRTYLHCTAFFEIAPSDSSTVLCFCSECTECETP